MGQLHFHWWRLTGRTIWKRIWARFDLYSNHVTYFNRLVIYNVFLQKLCIKTRGPKSGFSNLMRLSGVMAAFLSVDGFDLFGVLSSGCNKVNRGSEKRMPRLIVLVNLFYL